MNESSNAVYLAPTKIIDSDHHLVREYAHEITKDVPNDPVEIAIALYKRVRDDISYNPYIAYHREDSYQASNIVRFKKGYCVSKASLLCALGRVKGIPSRVGFSTVRNHIATKQLIKLLGTNEFVYHGYTEFLLNNRWTIATPAFDQATCKRHNVKPLDFNGVDDSKYQAYDEDKNLFMEYLEEHGSFVDVPLNLMMEAFRKKYGNQLVNEWIKSFDAMRGIAQRKFDKEDVYTHPASATQH